MDRRKFLALSLGSAGLVGAGSYLYPFDLKEPSLQKILDSGDNLNIALDRLLFPSLPKATEYKADDISLHFPSLGGFGAYFVAPNKEYDNLVRHNFKGWELKVGGLVKTPLSLSLPKLRMMPYCTSTVMHVCQEGWNAIAQWGGVRLSLIMQQASVLPTAKYAVFHAMDTIAGQKMYGSLPIRRCLHPQTLLAYEMNGQALPVSHGAPLRLRSALDKGYKQVKHLEAITFVASLAQTPGGKGGLFENYGYQKYGGL